MTRTLEWARAASPSIPNMSIVFSKAPIVVMYHVLLRAGERQQTNDQ